MTRRDCWLAPSTVRLGPVGTRSGLVRFRFFNPDKTTEPVRRGFIPDELFISRGSVLRAGRILAGGNGKWVGAQWGLPVSIAPPILSGEGQEVDAGQEVRRSCVTG